MLLIPCPWCGPRDASEFHYGGEAHIMRPTAPEALSDAEWADYLFMRTNTKGPFLERWVHSQGCRRWFNAARDTVSDRILAVYGMGENPPKAFAAAAPTPAKPRKRATKKTASRAKPKGKPTAKGKGRKKP